MTEKELIEIARRCAVNCSEHHSYMPSGPTSAACFWPHKWVLEAMAEAIKVALLAAGASEGQAETFEQWARGEGLISESHGVRFVNSMCDVARKAWNAAHKSAEIAALRERIAGMEKDAERWRYAYKHLIIGTQDTRNGFEEVYIEAIDAAIAKEPK